MLRLEASVARLVVLAISATLLIACASRQPEKVEDALVSPLSDLNLVNAEIPDALAAAANAPYLLAPDADCHVLGNEIRALDEVLGADLDAAETADNPGLIERGGDLAIGALRNAAQDVVPFRSWVRKISGAERYSKRVAAAIAAGSVRRGFLKGVRAARGCAAV